MNVSALIRPPRRPVPQLGLRGRVLWTTGNFLMLVGVYLLLYVGGLFADEQYNLLAAQGDSELALPDTAVVRSYEEGADTEANTPTRREVANGASAEKQVGGEPVVAPTAAPARFQMPQLNNPGGGRELNSLVPASVAGFGPSTVTRIAIPRIAVDRKVVEVGWTVEVVDGQEVAIWDVAKYAVGHHTGSANPGQPGNIVLAGHSGGRAYPFNDIYYLETGDAITLWSNGQQYQYTVNERLVLDEVGPGVTTEQRRANARYIEPSEQEIVTLVTCWPLTGPEKFNQRIVIRAVPNRPAEAEPPPDAAEPVGGWTVR